MRGDSTATNGGTLPDPVVFLFAGPAVPADFCGWVATDDDSGCDSNAYLETEQPAGTYTFAITEFSNTTGTYTVERNGFIAGPCLEDEICFFRDGDCEAGLACCTQEIGSSPDGDPIYEDLCTALGTTSRCLSCADFCEENEECDPITGCFCPNVTCDTFVGEVCCGEGQGCFDGSCGTRAGEGEPCDLVEGPDCLSGLVCDDNICVPSREGEFCDTAEGPGCPFPLECCSETCVFDGTPLSCVGICEPCPTPPHATATCEGFVCGFACDAGFADCDGDLENGCETDTINDSDHCGGCNAPCETGTCVDGACQ